MSAGIGAWLVISYGLKNHPYDRAEHICCLVIILIAVIFIGCFGAFTLYAEIDGSVQSAVVRSDGSAVKIIKDAQAILNCGHDHLELGISVTGHGNRVIDIYVTTPTGEVLKRISSALPMQTTEKVFFDKPFSGDLSVMYSRVGWDWIIGKIPIVVQ